MALVLAGCGGRQSALDPGGVDAEVLRHLFVVMLTGAAVIFVLVMGLVVWATWINPRKQSRRLAEAVIIGGGVVFPTVVLTALLSWGLTIMPDQRAPGGGLTLRVTGEQWWWRVEYWPEGATTPIIAANEIRLPTGSRAEIVLGSERVIHSFWIPSLAGKLDMFPGRETRLTLEPVRAGVYRGQCAEFCGLSHALMAFEAVVMEPEAFDAWLAREARDAQPPQDDLAAQGKAVFDSQGCGSCHAVRGTGWQGNVGPDLTHVGGRESLGAGIPEPVAVDFARWIAAPDAIKPGAEMPGYAFLGDADLAALGAYMESLR